MSKANFEAASALERREVLFGTAITQVLHGSMSSTTII